MKVFSKCDIVAKRGGGYPKKLFTKVKLRFEGEEEDGKGGEGCGVYEKIIISLPACIAHPALAGFGRGRGAVGNKEGGIGRIEGKHK